MLQIGKHMPKHEIHNLASKLVLGKSYPNVDKFIDWPTRFLGPKHRVWFHSWWEAFIIGAVIS